MVYKVYMIEDNDDFYDRKKDWPVHFVSAYKDKKLAEKDCELIEVLHNCSSKIMYGVITKLDVRDLTEYCFLGADSYCYRQIMELAKKYYPQLIKNSKNTDDLQKS